MNWRLEKVFYTRAEYNKLKKRFEKALEIIEIIAQLELSDDAKMKLTKFLREMRLHD